MASIDYLLAFVLWLGMALFAIAQRLLSQTTKCLAFSEIANGYIGNTYISPRLGNYGNHLYKTLSFIPVISLFAGFYALQTRGELWLTSAWFVSCFWISLTILFEFIFGHYVLGNSWEVLIADYRIWQGRLWLLILLSNAIAPLNMAWSERPRRESGATLVIFNHPRNAHQEKTGLPLTSLINRF